MRKMKRLVKNSLVFLTTLWVACAALANTALPTRAASLTSLTQAVAPDSPSGSIANGATNVTLAKFIWTAAGEDLRVATLWLNLNSQSGGTSIKNVRLLVDGRQAGATILRLNSGYTGTTALINLSADFRLTVGAPKTISIIADITDLHTVPGDTITIGVVATSYNNVFGPESGVAAATAITSLAQSGYPLTIQSPSSVITTEPTPTPPTPLVALPSTPPSPALTTTVEPTPIVAIPTPTVARATAPTPTAVPTPVATPTTAPTPANNVYQSVVQIKTFLLDSDFNLTLYGRGSGVFINNSGLILTNSHVVTAQASFDGSAVAIGYLVCLTLNTTDEPDCSYTAKLVNADDDTDLALLQIESITGLSGQTSFPSLSIAQTDTASINDEVTAIGYPAIGGRSVTITKGIVSGKTEKYGQQWLKTDAVTSLGSSGGAILDKNNIVVGMSTAVYSDFAGSLGYAISMASAYPWVAAHQYDAPKPNILQSRVADFVKQQKKLNQTNVFINPKTPVFSITNPADWEFITVADNQLVLGRAGDSGSGYINIYSEKYPYPVDGNNVLPYLKIKYLLKGTLQYFAVQENKNVTLGGLPAKKFFITTAQGGENFYAVPAGTRLLFVEYNYGADDKDQALVDTALQSLNVTAKNESAPPRTYYNAYPKFRLTANKDWHLLPQNSKDKPLQILNKKNKDIYVSVSVMKLPEDIKKMDNTALLKYYSDTITKVNRLLDTVDLKVDITAKNSRYKINNNITGVLKIDSVIKTPSDKKILAYKSDFVKRINKDTAIEILMIVTTSDKKVFIQAQKDFNLMLQKLAL